MRYFSSFLLKKFKLKNSIKKLIYFVTFTPITNN